MIAKIPALGLRWHATPSHLLAQIVSERVSDNPARFHFAAFIIRKFRDSSGGVHKIQSAHKKGGLHHCPCSGYDLPPAASGLWSANGFRHRQGNRGGCTDLGRFIRTLRMVASDPQTSDTRPATAGVIEAKHGPAMTGTVLPL